MFGYRGRFEITREVLAAVLGLPDGAYIDIFYEVEKDMYSVILRSEEPLSNEDGPLTYEVPEGMIIPSIEYILPGHHPVDIVDPIDEKESSN